MRRARRPAVAMVVALALALGLQSVPHIGANGSVPLAGRAPHPFPAGSARLYRLTATLNILQAVSLRTMADLPAPALRLGPIQPASQTVSIAVSSDGSRLAVMDQLVHSNRTVRARDITLQLFDARTGQALSARQHPAVPLLALMGVSADGSEVYGIRGDINFNTTCLTSLFYVLDTRTGRVLHHVTLAASPWDPILVGPNLQRLYTMTSTDHLGMCGPQWSYSATITAYDLQTERAVRSVRLKGILAGRWRTNQTVNGESVLADWTPGFALSPDGWQIAVLDGHGKSLTLIRAQTLRVMASEQLSRPQTTLQSIASALGLNPDSAAAKGQETGVNLQMQYTPDGRSLLVTGSRPLPDPHRLYGSAKPLGIQLVDIRAGQISTWLADRKQVIAIWPAPDGSAVYSLAQSWSRPGGWLTIVRRHDPATLQVRARRTFPHMDLNVLFLQ